MFHSDFYELAKQRLAPGGVVILSGILNEQADEVAEVYAQSGFNLMQRDKIVDWTTLTLGKLT